jgi:putative tryptophan/tyrosine transport system permease protein
VTLLIGALTIGFILSFLALGVFVSFRIFNFPDLTTEGSFALGGAIVAILLVSGYDPFWATILAFLYGAVAGVVTGFLRGRMKINELLAGILVMTSLYSVNLTIMGKSNIPLISRITLFSRIDALADGMSGASASFFLLWWSVSARNLFTLVITFLAVALFSIVLYLFLRTNIGTAMRAVGDNPQMIRALGVDTDLMIMLGIALANGCVALSGALLAQYQGFADVQMGIGMLVWGIASLIIGDNLIGARSPGLTIVGTIMGSLLFRLLISIALQWGMNPNHLKLLSAAMVLFIIVVPKFLGRHKKREAASHA